MSPEDKALIERNFSHAYGIEYATFNYEQVEALLQAARAEERGKWPTREEVIDAIWMNAPVAYEDTGDAADAILALFQKDKSL